MVNISIDSWLCLFFSFQCDCGDLDKNQRNQERCIETGWVGGVGVFVLSTTTKKPKNHDGGICRSYLRSQQSSSASHIPPTARHFVQLQKLNSIWEELLIFDFSTSFFGELLIRQSFTSLANISSHQCTGHLGHSHLHPDKQINDV